MSQTSSETETPDIIGVLRSVHSALDDALGDTDVSHIENDDELRDEYPVQWAAWWLMHAIEALEEARPSAGLAQTPAVPQPDELARERLAIARLRAAVTGEEFEWEIDGGSPFDDVQFLLAAYDRLAALSDTSTDRPEEITKAEMDAIEAAAIAGKPLSPKHD